MMISSIVFFRYNRENFHKDESSDILLQSPGSTGEIALKRSKNTRPDCPQAGCSYWETPIRVDNIPMTNVYEKTRRAALVSKVIEVSELLIIKLKSSKPLGLNDTVSFLISDGSDDVEVSDEERPAVSTSTPTRVSDTNLESTNVSENVRRVASGKTMLR
ncbi:hypothetical protein FQA39_LY07226 [Lamprigera yunnana]|nr:hypothetical protein FQA39_LY07226 [Lamprigera yunnana]